MKPMVLIDPTQVPTDDVVFAHLGKRRNAWEALFRFIEAEHPDVGAAWRYYRDGKSWLLNVSRKKKTVFWLSVFAGGFSITAYFTDRAAEAIRASTLSEDLKTQFLRGRRYGTLGAVTITFTKKRDVEDAKTLIALKLAAR